ncbi:MAG TPA: PQQ-dependent sugar dehydrogenase [Polyangiaceae bacterium]|nr:PQQ-dependent sugar dehydrogenase [Polyangiaceae bacterium]
MTSTSKRIRTGAFSKQWLVMGALITLSGYACSDDDDTTPGPSGGRSATGGSGGRSGGTTGSVQGGRSSGGRSSGGTVAVPEAGEAGGGTLGIGGEQPGAGAGGSAEAGRGGEGGTPESPQSGGSAGVGGVGGEGGVSDGSGGVVSADPDVFRPAQLPMSQELVDSLSLPTGFQVNVFASGLKHARMLATHGPHLYVTRPMQNDVLVMTDADQDGVADTPTAAVTGLSLVHGIAFHGDNVYLSTVSAVYRAAVNPNGTFGTPAVIVDDLPGGGQHPYRTLGVGPDDKLYISVGSDCDACAETNPENAALLRTNLDGTSREIYATGLRNMLGFGWHPTTGKLWGVDNGSDWRGDLLPPEELNQVVLGADYGWPYCFGKQQIDPVIQDPPDKTKAAYCASTQPSVLEDDAHGAPTGLVFYSGTSFPEVYRGAAFVALHGSWNRFPPSGYKIAQVRFDAQGNPVAFSDFVTGFLVQGATAQFGRPTALTVGPDGALYFSDDANGVLYRVQYVNVE